MGNECGPVIANTYLMCLEKSYITIYKPLFYGRFIDDILNVALNEADIEILIGYFKYLKLTEVSNDVVNFLDLNISYDKLTEKLIFSLYTKPTQTFSYLLFTSNHPDFIKNNLPKGIFIRIRRICSSTR